MEPPASTTRPFTRLTDESAFSCRHYRLYSTKVNVFRPPRSLISDHRPWITAVETTANHTTIFRHPLTSKPYSLTFPKNSDLSKLNPSTIAFSCHLGESYPVDYLLNYPSSDRLVDFYYHTNSILLALYGGGQLQGCPSDGPEERRRRSGSDFSPWVKLSPHLDFDDVAVFRNKIYAVERGGLVCLIHSYKSKKKFKVGGHLMAGSVMPGLGRFGWRKRFVVYGGKLQLVVRTAEKSFRVYMLMKQGKNPNKGFYWSEAKGFDGKVLFMARNYYFFRKATRMFPGREYRNCIVFSEAAFPQYGNDCWEFTLSGDRQFSEDDIAVFSLSDESFAREGENSGFPRIDWSPPTWIFTASSVPADEFRKYTTSESSSQSEREPEEDHRLDSDRRYSGDKNDGEVQSDLKDSKSKEDEEEQEEMEFDFGLLDQDQDQDGVVSDSANPDNDDGNRQCGSDSQEKEDVEMHSEEANIEVDASLQVAHVTPSSSAVEEEVTRILLRMNSENNSIEEETSGKNITHAIHKASTLSRTESHKSDSPTTKFEGFDIRSDLIPTLQKIWQKHGNVIKDSTMRSSDILARALESLATMVRILEDNPAQSLSDGQADYLSSTLSDLKCIRFKVCWLISFVEKALLVHKSKYVVESLNNLNQLSSQGEERRAILLNELAKLDKEQNKLKEETTKVSKMLPFSGQVKFDEPIGAGLT